MPAALLSDYIFKMLRARSGALSFSTAEAELGGTLGAQGQPGATVSSRSSLASEILPQKPNNKQQKFSGWY